MYLIFVRVRKESRKSYSSSRSHSRHSSPSKSRKRYDGECVGLISSSYSPEQKEMTKK